MPLINPADVPEEICSPDGVAAVNEVIDNLQGRRVVSINMQEPPKGFRVSNMVRAYCQGQLWRCLDLVESAETLRRADHGLGAMIMVRATYETVAAFLHFEAKLDEAMEPVESEADLERVHDFVHGKTFATRLADLLKEVGADESARATSILTQIDQMKRVYEDARKDYDHLCEFAHPNVFGGFLWFADHNPRDDTVSFSATGPNAGETLFWSIQGAHMLSHFDDAFQRIEAKLPELTELGNKKPV